MHTKLNNTLFDALLLEANNSTRKRSHFNLHSSHEDQVQRLCIALKKGTYIRPHHHPQKNKWELMLPLRGEVALVLFDSQGTITEKLTLTAANDLSAFEMPPNTWHTVFPITDDAIILEVKEGPYTPAQETDFATWAPAEGNNDVDDFLTWLEAANVGQTYG